MARTLGKFQTHAGESILFDGPGAYVYDNGVMENGRCIITSQRVAFCLHSKLAPAFLVQLFKIKASTELLEIPLDSVQSIEQKVNPRIKMATVHVVHTAGNYHFSFLMANKYNVRWVTSFQAGMELVHPGVQSITQDSRIVFAG